MVKKFEDMFHLSLHDKLMDREPETGTA